MNKKEILKIEKEMEELKARAHEMHARELMAKYNITLHELKKLDYFGYKFQDLPTVSNFTFFEFSNGKKTFLIPYDNYLMPEEIIPYVTNYINSERAIKKIIHGDEFDKKMDELLK